MFTHVLLSFLLLFKNRTKRYSEILCCPRRSLTINLQGAPRWADAPRGRPSLSPASVSLEQGRP